MHPSLLSLFFSINQPRLPLNFLVSERKNTGKERGGCNSSVSKNKGPPKIVVPVAQIRAKRGWLLHIGQLHSRLTNLQLSSVLVRSAAAHGLRQGLSHDWVCQSWGKHRHPKSTTSKVGLKDPAKWLARVWLDLVDGAMEAENLAESIFLSWMQRGTPVRRINLTKT